MLRSLWQNRAAPAEAIVNQETLRDIAAANVYREVAPATVLVRTPGGIGTGFLISKDGWLLTNHHVIEDSDVDPVSGAQRPLIHLGRLQGGFMQLAGAAVAALVYKDDAEKDLALLKLADRPAGFDVLPTVVLAKAAPMPGDNCVVIGHPRAAMLWTVRGGMVTGAGKWPGDRTREVDARLFAAGYNEEDRKRLAEEYAAMPQTEVLVSNCGVNYGDSGGPLVSVRGELIGVTFAMPSSESSGGAATSFSYHIGLGEVKGFIADRPSEPLLFVPSPWPAGIYSSLLDLDADGVKETLAFALARDKPPTGFLIDLAGKNSADVRKMSAQEISQKRAWRFQFALLADPSNRVFYDTDNTGRIDLILMQNGGAENDWADHVLRLVDGQWEHEAAHGIRLCDPALFKDKELKKRLEQVLSKLQSAK